MTFPIDTQAPRRTRKPRTELQGTHQVSQAESNRKWRATKAALGVDYVNFLLPAAIVEDYRERAEEDLLAYYQKIFVESPGSHAIIADLRKPVVMPVSFDVFVQEHPEFLEGGKSHRKAKALYDSFVTSLRESAMATADAHTRKMAMQADWTKSAARAYIMARYTTLYQRKMAALIAKALPVDGAE